ncbi:MAG: choice-of-anchor A family protein [Verrucomicrobiales bacterium]
MKKHSPILPLSVLCLSLAGSLSSHGAGVAIELLTRFNVLVGDYNANNETEGSAFVYGSYSPSGSNARFGFNSGSVSDDAEYTLWLNNGTDTSATTTLQSGSVVSRTAVSESEFTLQGNGSTGTPSVVQGETAWSDALGGLGLGLTSTADVVTALSDASTYWAALSANSTGTTPGNGSYTFSSSPESIDGSSVAIFHVTSAELFDASGFDRLELNLNGADSVLINVSGTDIDIAKNFSNGFVNNESQIVFNFYEAETITIDSNFRGTIFAPFADVVQNANIDGGVVAASLTQTKEIHSVGFDAYFPEPEFSSGGGVITPVPEPSHSALLLFVGSLAMVGFRRR